MTTFAVLVGVMCVLGAYGHADQDMPINTTLCELKKTPEKFNGKMVRVRGTVVSALEWSGLHDAACDTYLLSGTSDFPALSGRTGEYAFIRYLLEVDDPERLILEADLFTATNPTRPR